MSPMPVEVQFISGTARGKSLLIKAKVKGMCKAGTYSGAVDFDVHVVPDGGRLILRWVDFCGGPPYRGDEEKQIARPIFTRLCEFDRQFPGPTVKPGMVVGSIPLAQPQAGP